MVKTYPNQTEDLFAALNLHQTASLGSKYEFVFYYIARTNISLYLKLAEKYNISERLGWRATDRIIKTDKQAVLEGKGKFCDLLHDKQIVRSLRNDYINYYVKRFPDHLGEFESSWSRLYNMISHLSSKTQKANLVLGAFEKAYGCSILDHPQLVMLELLELLPANTREAFVTTAGKLKATVFFIFQLINILDKPSTIPEEKWWSYMTTQNSVPLLKKKLCTASDLKYRTDIIEYLLDTCKINDDIAALAELCSYIVAQHRNDHISLRSAFLRLLKSNFDLLKLQDEHWNPITALMLIYKLNKEYLPGGCEFLEKYIRYRLLRGLPVKDQLLDIIRQDTYSFDQYLLCNEPTFGKQLLVMLPHIKPESCADDMPAYLATVMKAIIRWNIKHPKDKVDILPYMKMDEFNLAKEISSRFYNVEGKFLSHN